MPSVQLPAPARQLSKFGKLCNFGGAALFLTFMVIFGLYWYSGQFSKSIILDSSKSGYATSINRTSPVGKLFSRDASNPIGFVNYNNCVKIENNGTTMSIPSDWGPLLVEFVSSLNGNISLIILDTAALQCLHNRSNCCQVFTESGFFHFGVLEDTYKQQIKPSKVPTKSWRVNRTSHYAVYWKRPERKILISQIETRNEYWYIDQVDFLGLDIPAKAFLKFNLTALPFTAYNVKMNKSTFAASPVQKTYGQQEQLTIPEDIDFHLWISPHSSFISCNTSIRDQFYAQNPQEQHAIPRVGPDGIRKAAYVRDFLFKYRVLPMLSGGTLLGWYRQCATISYTNDVDLMFPISQYSEKLLNGIACNENLGINHVIGFVDRSLELSVMKESLMIDLFPLYPDGKNVYLATVDYRGHKILREVYPAIESTVAVDLHGYLFYAPANTIDILLAVYGDTWMNPKQHYVWYSSPKNLQAAGSYSRAEWQQHKSTHSGSMRRLRPPNANN